MLRTDLVEPALWTEDGNVPAETNARTIRQCMSYSSSYARSRSREGKKFQFADPYHRRPVAISTPRILQEAWCAPVIAGPTASAHRAASCPATGVRKLDFSKYRTVLRSSQ